MSYTQGINAVNDDGGDINYVKPKFVILLLVATNPDTLLRQRDDENTAKSLRAAWPPPYTLLDTD
jgi:hypothetical protein